MIFKNLTPHKVVLEAGDLRVVFERDSTMPVARVDLNVEETRMSYEVAPGFHLELPVNIVTRASIHGLPEPDEGVIYIVSSMVANHAKRPDVIAPITDASATRDTSGRVVSVRGFQTFAEDIGNLRDFFEAGARKERGGA